MKESTGTTCSDHNFTLSESLEDLEEDADVITLFSPQSPEAREAVTLSG